MLKFFSLPILLAFALGYQFPYIALNLSQFAFIILFLMMTSMAIDLEWSIVKKLASNKKEIAFGLFFQFLFFPLFQWLLARHFINDKSLLYGTFLASLCPVAIVAPSFSKMFNADEELSILLVIISMFLFPLALYVAMILTNNSLHLSPILIDMIILVFFPVFLGLVLKWLDKNFFQNNMIKFWKQIAAEFNMFSIAFLAFIYFGASVAKINLNYTSWTEILGVLGIIFFQDFGVYFLSKWLMRKFFSEEKAMALCISISMKNMAVSGAILLFYDPKASLASAVGFLIHAIFFNFLVIHKPKKVVLDN